MQSHVQSVRGFPSFVVGNDRVVYNIRFMESFCCIEFGFGETLGGNVGLLAV